MRDFNKKGFTLVELLAVIVILLVILSVAFPQLAGSLERQKERDVEQQHNSFINAAQVYVENNGNTLNGLTDTISVGIPLSTLVRTGHLTGPLKSVEDNTEINTSNTVKVSKGANTYLTYEYCDGISCVCELPNCNILVYEEETTGPNPTLTPLIEVLEKAFGKTSGDCVPTNIPSGNTLYVDTNCAYAGIDGRGQNSSIIEGSRTIVIRDPQYNYIKLAEDEANIYRIMKVAKDSDGTVGIRLLANPNLFTDTYQFHNVNNEIWDNADIRKRLNNIDNPAINLYNTIFGLDQTKSEELVNKLVTMKYDAGTTTECNGARTTCTINQNITWTSNANLVGLPSLREMRQMHGEYLYSGITNTNTWSYIDNNNEWNFLISKLVFATVNKATLGFSTTSPEFDNYVDSTSSQRIRPVININPTTNVIRGNGSAINPYVLE